MRAMIAISTILLLSPAMAQSGPGESEQRLACMGDAFRLCSQHIPDRDAVRLCMAAQHSALSAGCRTVFDASMKAFVQRTGHR